jgi:hypothetical protein
VNAVIANYLATWNATGEDRRQLLDAHWDVQATYTDPLAEVRGHQELSTLIDSVQEQFPDFVFSPHGEPEGHHRQYRFQWGLGPDGAQPAVVGFDVVVVDDAGKIVDVRGFLDVVPQ